MVLTADLSNLTIARYAALLAIRPARTDLLLAVTKPLQHQACDLGFDIEFLGEDDIFLPAHGEKAASRLIVPGNTDLVMMALFRRRPWYDYIWMVEHDVFFLDSGAILFALDAASDADLIVSHHPGSRAEAPDWHWWPSFRASPEAAAVIAHEDCLQSLFCVSRYSARLFAALEQEYRKGWVGHHECTVPTIARYRGLTIEAANTIAHRCIGREVLSGTTFNVDGCIAEPGALIYHPVKSEQVLAQLMAGIAALGA